MGVDGAERGRLDRTLTKRTMSGRRAGPRNDSEISAYNLAALADHDLGIKGKTTCQFGAELRLGDWPPDHEGARRADVDGIEVLQLFGEHGRSEVPVTADVDPSQKNHECHAFPPAAAA